MVRVRDPRGLVLVPRRARQLRATGLRRARRVCSLAYTRPRRAARVRAVHALLAHGHRCRRCSLDASLGGLGCIGAPPCLHAPPCPTYDTHVGAGVLMDPESVQHALSIPLWGWGS